MNRSRFHISFISGRCRAGLLIGYLVVSWWSAASWADPVQPSANDRYITFSVAQLLLREHLSEHDLDDEISQRCLDTFLKSLDPWKVYFYQSDIDAFRKRRNDLDDMARKGDVTFAHTVFKTYLQRIDERVKVIDALLAAEHDFTVDEEMIIDREEARWPQTASEARNKWRRRIKYDLLVLKTDEIEGQKARDKLRRRYHSIAKRAHQTSREELLEMYLTSLTTSFDPHTSYLSAGSLENFEIMMRLELDGIGASLQDEDGYTVVRKIVPDGAADKDGRLQIEDKIVGVGQDTEGEIVDTVDMKLTDVVKMIRGERGTVVRLEIIPGDGSKRKTIAITRARIELKDSEAHAAVFEAGAKTDGNPYKIGVIKLPSFYMDMEGFRRGDPNFKSATRDVRKILDGFLADGIDAVILDLRLNGGGSLIEAINLTGLFIDTGPVVKVKGRPDSGGDATPRLHEDFDPGTAWAGPLVVLTDKFSASASEIYAGAMQDYHRGLIVGDKSTHGKGTVQSLVNLGRQMFRGLPNPPAIGALKITMQQYYRPNGDSTQNRGVLADIELPSLKTHLDIAEADLDYSVAFDKVEPLEFRQYNYINPTIRDQLRRLSEQRRSGNEEFRRVLKKIARYKQQKAKKTVTLHEEKFLAERAELNAERQQEKTLKELNDFDAAKIKRDYYMDEALAITVDYLKLQQVAKR